MAERYVYRRLTIFSHKTCITMFNKIVEPVGHVNPYEPLTAVEPVNPYESLKAVEHVNPYEPLTAVEPVNPYNPLLGLFNP